MTTLGRVMFWMLVPAFTLPLYGISWGLHAAGSHTDSDYVQVATLLAFAVFMHVLLASMVVNAWLLLRHPVYWRTKSLPPRVSVAQACLYVIVLAWHVQLAFAVDAPIPWVFVIATMALSITVHKALVRGHPRVQEQFENVRFSRGAKLMLRVYVVLSVLTFIGAVVFFALAAETGEHWWWGVPVAIGVNLPWTLVMPLVFGFVLVPLFSSAPPAGLVVGLIAIVLTHGCNILIARGLLSSPERATAMMNRVFRLGTVKP